MGSEHIQFCDYCGRQFTQDNPLGLTIVVAPDSSGGQQRRIEICHEDETVADSILSDLVRFEATPGVQRKKTELKDEDD